ncbi:MAG: hypothetical protein ACMV0F_04120 [Trichlorobacter sp.]
MTKFQKQMLTIAAAGALTAVTALPAMAFENEFHGLFNIYGDYGNVAATGANGNNEDSVKALKKFLGTSSKADNYIEQRVRLQYIAKASDDLKLVTHFEINNRFGGAATGAGDLLGGSDIDTDGINLQTKHAYLDFNVVKGVNVKAGLQAYKDSIGGLLVDADLPAVVVTTKLGGVDALVGFSRYSDSATLLGDQAGNFTFADFSYPVNKDTKVGFSYYYQSQETPAVAEIASGTQIANLTTGVVASATTAQQAAASVAYKKSVHTFALNGQTKLNGISLKAFVAMQDGEKQTASTTTDYSGYAANIQADASIAGGNAKLGYLFVSGDTKTASTDDSQFQTLGTTGSTFNEGGMMLMVRNNYFYPTTTSYALKGNTVSNIQLAYAGYSKMLSDKLKATANIGLGWDNTDVGTTAGTKGDFIGTEVNAELAYKLYPNLNVYAQAGYISLGSQYDAYKDPYAVRLGASFSF